jgi:hypothetical protein
MIRNPTFLMNVQIAFMGILVVAGMFFIWRYLNRMEDKLDNLEKLLMSRPQMAAMPMHIPSPVMDDQMAEDLMNEVFGSAAPIFLNSFAKQEGPVMAPEAGVRIEEMPTSAAPAPSTDGPGSVQEDDENRSVTPGLSKTKVRRMTSDALRELCAQMGLSTEGTRPELMDRILSTIGEHGDA